MLREKFIALNTYISREDLKFKNPGFYLCKLEKEQFNPKASKGKEIIQIRAEINEAENRKI